MDSKTCHFAMQTTCTKIYSVSRNSLSFSLQAPWLPPLSVAYTEFNYRSRYTLAARASALPGHPILIICLYKHKIQNMIEVLKRLLEEGGEGELAILCITR